jgi:hypothetical protein
VSGRRKPWDRQRTTVLLALAAGLSRAAASSKAGVVDRTLRRWVAEDESFAEAVEVAMGEGRAVYEQLLREAGQKDWRAALAAYEVIYLGGRSGKAESNVAVMVTSAPPAPHQLTDEEKAATFAHAREVVRVLLGAVGPERTAEVIAKREQERRQIG